jgi:hypothetical protein
MVGASNAIAMGFQSMMVGDIETSSLMVHLPDRSFYYSREAGTSRIQRGTLYSRVEIGGWTAISRRAVFVQGCIL